MEKNQEYAKIKLNNEDITISYYSMLIQDSLFAYNSRHQKIAKCSFEIFDIFERPLTLEEQKNITKSRLNDPEPNKMYIGNTYRLYYGDKVNNKEFTLDDKLYKLISSYCRLNFISILDENYYKKGVGSALIKTLENLAISKGCDYIKGIYSPSQPFPDGAKSFYQRNGYQIKRIGDCLYPTVFKNLNKEKPLET